MLNFMLVAQILVYWSATVKAVGGAPAKRSSVRAPPKKKSQ
jgi:hypothetical protein